MLPNKAQIEAQARGLADARADIHHAGHQLQTAFWQRATSPKGLAASFAVGFGIGYVFGLPESKLSVNRLAALTNLISLLK
ncbi:hypothetical protein [Motiliproteus sp. SC1-56]|uniref:hypothetical protein n=1 Tax=Motiliproteus sp. SC1-56 TaxID=2799565 RepID=UPI001A8FA09A|nr:hypothetical protein [Motiliproteus sp. SC1-56]